jgi:hypothetical protein
MGEMGQGRPERAFLNHRDLSQAAFLGSPTGRGLYEDTESSDREALALVQHLGMRPIVARCHVGLGRLYRQDDAGSG